MPASTEIDCSVVIPTAGKPSHVARTLRALSEQSIDRTRYEIIVADNNQNAEGSRLLELASAPFDVHVIAAPTAGAAAARNAGALRARGRVLVFVDDDVLVPNDFIATHLAVHAGASGALAVGHIDERNLTSGWFHQYLVRNAVVHRVDDPHHITFKNVYGANFSILRADFDRLAGFDEQFVRREDAELGVRAVEAGLVLKYVPGASIEHHSDVGAQAHVRRSYRNGYYLAMLVDKHPTVAKNERMSLYRPWLRYVSYAAAIPLMVVGLVLAPLTQKVLHKGVTALVLAESSRGFAAFGKRGSVR